VSQENGRIGWVILLGLIALPFVAVAAGVYSTIAIGGDAVSAAITTGTVMGLVFTLFAVYLVREVIRSNRHAKAAIRNMRTRKGRKRRRR
jgi:small-conductance mechanosensitive channel